MEGQIQLTHDLYSIILAANANNLNLGLPPPKKSPTALVPNPELRTVNPKPQTPNPKSQTLNPKP